MGLRLLCCWVLQFLLAESAHYSWLMLHRDSQQVLQQEDSVGEHQQEEAEVQLEDASESACLKFLGNATAEALATAAPAQPGGPPTVYFLHIPKAAGISFNMDARAVLASTPVAYVAKEGCFEWSKCIPDAGVVTLLRNPRAHVLSQYVHCKSMPDRPESLREIMPPFEEWLMHWIEMRDEGKADDDFAPQLPHDVKAPVPNTATRAPFKCYDPIDLQTQRMACHKTYNYKHGAQEDRLGIALANMHKSFMVGLVEAYQETLCLLYEKVHHVLAPGCDCSAEQEGHEAVWGHHVTHGVTRHNPADVPEEAFRLIDRVTESDQELYKQAARRFFREVREIEQRHKAQVFRNSTMSKLQPWL